MNKLRWLTGLMVVTLLVITGFQVYWLLNNYDREKRTLEIRANMNFQETVRRLQAIKLKLPDPGIGDSAHGEKMRVFVSDDMPGDKQVRLNALPRQEMITIVNTMRNKLKDSLKKDSGVLISINKISMRGSHDPVTHNIEERTEVNGNKIFKILSGVDSLQDSLQIPEITAAYSKSMKAAKLDIPFKVLRLDSAGPDDEADMGNVTLGFTHPVTYRLETGNTMPYLLKRILMPILFSVFLVGVTLLSFLLVYRTMLKQQRLAVIKNEFISNITHELKTPIATVGVAIEALKNFNAMQDPARTKEYLDISSNELQRLSLLVDKVLKLSMLEKKEIELKFESLDLRSVVDEVVTSLRLQLEKYKASVKLNAEGDLNLEADRLHLLSVVFNLLDNALKYSKANPVIEIDLKEKGQNIELKVSDNGIGILPEYKDKVFEKFFRVPTGDTHNAKGYGLGLSYVAHIVARHGGTVTAESEAGKGTSFIILLPKKHETR